MISSYFGLSGKLTIDFKMRKKINFYDVIKFGDLIYSKST